MLFLYKKENENFPHRQSEVNKVPKKYLQSPLRYPGGKSRAVKYILSFMPLSTKTLCSPFFGGGSVELACLARGMQVYGYDAFKPLTDFWQELLLNNEELVRRVQGYFPLEKTRFYNLQKNYGQLADKKEHAAIYFVLNRASFSGTTLSGGMASGHPRFSQSAINKLKNFKTTNLSVGNKDFTETLEIHKNDFLYLDPPYANGGALYGKRGDMHKNFPHELLAQILVERENWILSYNDCKLVRMLYKGFKFIELNWGYGMNKTKKSNEVLIISNNLPL